MHVSPNRSTAYQQGKACPFVAHSTLPTEEPMSKKPMAGKRIQDIPQTAIRIEPAVVDQLNRFCADHPLRPRRDSVIEVAIIEYVEREQDKIAEARSKREALQQSPN